MTCGKRVLRPSRPPGLVGLTAFFLFGGLTSLLTALALLQPGGALEPMWRLKPDARASFLQMGGWAVVLMATVCVGCCLAAVGLWRATIWGYRLALGILGMNLLGDTANALLRRDWRTLIGLPIGGLLLWYLHRLHSQNTFGPGHRVEQPRRAPPPAGR